MPRADSLQRGWYEERPPSAWTLPVASLFGGAVRVRRALYRCGWLHSTHLPVPVIVVGNITVGGSGKTPLTIALVEALRARGFVPGVVSRGYGGSAQEPMLLDDAPDPRVVGDEPALIRLRTGAAVAVGRGRPAAARLLLDRKVDVIVADDGLQHYALARDIEICVVDGERRFGNARQLPAGPLREPVSRLREVDFIVCNGGDARDGEYAMSLQCDRAIDVRVPSRSRPLRDFSATRVHAVAGIGHPPHFFAMLREQGIEVIEHPFPDHHGFIATDLSFGDGLPVLMTEKDAVKCRAFAGDSAWSVPVSAGLSPGFLDGLFARLEAAR